MVYVHVVIATYGIDININLFIVNQNTYFIVNQISSQKSSNINQLLSAIIIIVHAESKLMVDPFYSDLSINDHT